MRAPRLRVADQRQIETMQLVQREADRAMSALRCAADWAEHLDCDGVFLAMELREHADLIEKLRP